MRPITESIIRPSDVFNRVMRQHRAVGTLLDEVARGAKTLLAGRPYALKHLIARTRELCDELTNHIVFETKNLVPALRDADAWGNVRATNLLTQLRARTRKVEDLRKSCVNGTNETLADDIGRFIDDRRADMAQTERDSVNTRVLRDDVICVDTDGG
jgi:hypothetical protein